jgi:hypothetical protein
VTAGSRRLGRRRKRFGALVAMAVLGGAVTSCSLFGSDDDARPTAPKEAAGVEVLSVGRAPRRPVRLALTPGSSTTVRMTVDVDVSRAEGVDDPLTVAVPPLVEDVRLDVEAVEGRRATIAFEIVDAHLDTSGTELTPPQVVGLTAAAQQVIGVKGRATLRDTGAMSGVSYAAPAGADARVTASLRELPGQLTGLVPPFPNAALGTGARWRVTRTVRTPLPVTTTSTYTVTALTRTTLTYEVAVRQRSTRAVPLDTLVGGRPARLVASELTGSGTGTVGLAALSFRGRSTLTGHQDLEVGAGDPPTASRQTVRLAVQVGPVP